MKELLFNTIENLRYERKFYVEDLTAREVELIVKHHPAMFKEIYYERRVNSLYFDKFKFKHFTDSLDGESKRIKVRIRWYGDLFGSVKDPILEFKFKSNTLVGKLLYPISSFQMNEDISAETMRDILRDSSLPENIEHCLQELNPYIAISYSRKYFLSADGLYRITIDRDVNGYRMRHYHNNFSHQTKSSSHIILECKYDRDTEKDISSITNLFPFRMTKSSKYVDGMVEVWG